METFETDGAYGRSRDEFRGVPAGMEAFGPVVACEPLAPERWRGPDSATTGGIVPPGSLFATSASDSDTRSRI